MLPSPTTTGQQNLESIARGGSRLQRMTARIPTYLTDLRENPAWLPMFMLARTMPGRRMHWLGAKRARPVDNAGDTMFAGVERATVVDALRADGLFSGLVLPPEVH